VSGPTDEYGLNPGQTPFDPRGIPSVNVAAPGQINQGFSPEMQQQYFMYITT